MDEFENEIAEAIARAALDGDSRRHVEESFRNPPRVATDKTAAVPVREPDDDERNPVAGFVGDIVEDWAEAPFTGTLGYMTTYPGNPVGWFGKVAKGGKVLGPMLKELGWDTLLWSDFGGDVKGPFARANDVERELWKTLSNPDNVRHMFRGLGMTARENMEKYLDRNTPGGIKR